MKIIKKDGIIEDFSKNKLSTSIYNASLDSDSPMNQSDLNVLTEFILDKLNKIRKDYTSSYEIFGITFSALCTNKFLNVAESYISFLLNK